MLYKLCYYIYIIMLLLVIFIFSTLHIYISLFSCYAFLHMNATYYILFLFINRDIVLRYILYCFHYYLLYMKAILRSPTKIWEDSWHIVSSYTAMLFSCAVPAIFITHERPAARWDMRREHVLFTRKWRHILREYHAFIIYRWAVAEPFFLFSLYTPLHIFKTCLSPELFHFPAYYVHFHWAYYMLRAPICFPFHYFTAHMCPSYYGAIIFATIITWQRHAAFEHIIFHIHIFEWNITEDIYIFMPTAFTLFSCFSFLREHMPCHSPFALPAFLRLLEQPHEHTCPYIYYCFSLFSYHTLHIIVYYYIVLYYYIITESHIFMKEHAYWACLPLYHAAPQSLRVFPSSFFILLLKHIHIFVIHGWSHTVVGEVGYSSRWW